MTLSSVHYETDVMPPELLKKVVQEVKNIQWCRPPAGIPGNYPPRYTAALGDGSHVSTKANKVFYKKQPNFPNITSYPLFQCAKNSSAHYQMNKIPPNLVRLISILRQLVKKNYGENAININDMFNVCVCNYYTQDNHQIADHRDDERWLAFNELNNGTLSASIIASLTIYPDEIPDTLRRFQIYDDNVGIEQWTTMELEHNSIVFFSNHRHRAPAVKRGASCKRINITFRTLSSGLLGLTGYGNFYRYMSIPYQITYVDPRHFEHSKQFVQSVIDSNNFNNRLCFDPNIVMIRADDSERKILKKRYKNSIDVSLNRYVSQLCTVENYASSIKS